MDNECEQQRSKARQLNEQLEEYKRLREDQEAQLAATSIADVTDLGNISNISEAGKRKTTVLMALNVRKSSMQMR